MLCRKVSLFILLPLSQLLAVATIDGRAFCLTSHGGINHDVINHGWSGHVTHIGLLSLTEGSIQRVQKEFPRCCPRGVNPFSVPEGRTTCGTPP